MAFDLQNPVHVIVILVFVAPALIGLRIVLQSWSTNYWIRRFRVKADAAGCRARFEQELNYHLDLMRGRRGGRDVREIRGAYETARQHIALFPAEADRQLAEVGEVAQAWKDHAYPLQGIKIELQGTRHSDKADLLSQLKEVVARIKSGDTDGESSDDDFGYKFTVTSAAQTSIFGDEPFTQK